MSDFFNNFENHVSQSRPDISIDLSNLSDDSSISKNPSSISSSPSTVSNKSLPSQDTPSILGFAPEPKTNYSNVTYSEIKSLNNKISELKNTLVQAIDNNNNNNVTISNLQQIQRNQEAIYKQMEDKFQAYQSQEYQTSNYIKGLVIGLVIILIVTIIVGYFMLRPKSKRNRSKHPEKDKYTLADWFLMTILLLICIIIIVIIVFLLLKLW